MSNWGRRPITDAGKAKTSPPNITYFFDGEERLDRRPLGKVERFVDPQGNVMSLQVYGDGDPQRQVTADRQRMLYRRDGFVEHAKCPLRHGIHLMAGQTSKDFTALPASLHTACDADPRTMTKERGELHATKACPHIEWLIEARREKESKQATKRNAARMAVEKREADKRELEELQLAMAKEQLEERKAKKSAKPAPVTKE